MKTTRTISVLVAVFLLAMGAGVVTGVLASRAPAASGSSVVPIADHSSGLDDLHLTTDQRERMRGIWEAVRDTAHQCTQESQRLQKQREDDLVQMLSEEQKSKYSRLSQTYASDVAKLNAKRQEAFRHAVEQTKQMLSPEQRQAYDQMIQNRVGQLGPTGATQDRESVRWAAAPGVSSTTHGTP